ncbi:CoA transferase [Pseudomonas sp. CFBP 13602]|uniref:CoA transferase n=1 Tax=Pseudomonas sp. CFBP 13602 TaxID=2774039 RepID=UPI001786E571|nr:CoA transferase [Pseudomonas sp. CFBP 13602]MBD8828566.1 CoA transferase [Pseudomonas sp. CFBP 13602]
MNYDLLKSVRVIESSAFIAAPLCGMTLAQLGAEVIRVDLIGGGIDYQRLPMMPEGRSIYWTSLNKAKKSVAIDIKRPEGRELLQQLVGAPGEAGGILLTNIGTPWLSHKLLSELRPDLISCTIEGNFDGSTAVDYTVNCATGYPMLTGNGSADRPVNHTLPAWDVICANQAATAIVAAVARRQQTGEGAEIRLALSDSAFSTLSHLGLLTESELIEQPRESLGNYLYGAFGHDFATNDGRRVMIVAISSRQWRALVKACDLEGVIESLQSALGVNFDNESDRFKGRELLGALVKQWCSKRSLAQIEAHLTQHGVAYGPYRTVRQLLHEDNRVSLENPVFERITTSGVGEHLAAGTPLRVGQSQRHAIQPAPELGQNTDEVLADLLGLSQQEISALRDKGIVAGASD